MAKNIPVQHVDLEITLCGVTSFIVSNIRYIIGSPLQGLSRSKASLIDHSFNSNVIGKDGFIPGYKSRSIGGGNPNIA
jgi:hypothetical protein